MPSIRQTADRRDRYLVSLTDAYRENLAAMVTRAQASVLSDLQARLKLTLEGLAPLTAGNRQAFEQIDKLFLERMNELGFQALLRSFVGAFPQTLPLFRETLDSINQRLKEPLPELRFRAMDQRVMVQAQTSAKSVLQSAVEAGAAAARRNALLTAGALPFRDLASGMSTAFQRSIGESQSLAATALSTYYRTLAAQGFRNIQAGLPEGKELLYRYVGPKDRLTRPFCRARVNGKSYRLSEIEAMDNGSTLPNVLLFGGGYNCRHSWVVEGLAQTSAKGERTRRWGVAAPASDEFRFDPNSTIGEGRFRLKDPALFKGGYFRRQSSTPGVSYILGVRKDDGRQELQTIRFDRRRFDEAKAAAWWAKNRARFDKQWNW